MEMHKKMKWATLAAVLALVGTTWAQEQKPVGPRLTPRLRQLLSEEMLSIKQATEQILGAIVTGEHQTVATLALQIHDSFILKKQLTEKDKRDLTKAPPAFLSADATFHHTAMKLHRAAHEKDRELELFYFRKMVEGCQGCHASFASDKFPGFSGKIQEAHVH